VNNCAKENSMMLEPKESTAFVFKFLSYKKCSSMDTVRISLTSQGVRQDDIYIQPQYDPLFINKSYLLLKPECRNTAVAIDIPLEGKTYNSN
jgi:hypothetical protein